MSDDGTNLPFGLYERLITASLKARLLQFDRSRSLVTTEGLDPAEAPSTLARHIESLVARALKSLPAEERSTAQANLVNQLLQLLVTAQPTSTDPGDLVALPPEQLISIQPITGFPTTDRELLAPIAPPVPLSASDLLVNARGEPALAHALAREIPSADSIDLLCAFVRWHGFRLLEKQLKEHCDTQSTRLHAKAWMFRRETGYSTAYIGSSNLSKAALVDGVEWNVRLSQVGSPDLLEKFDATFNTYWESPEYESYETERERHGRRKNLVAAATGAGKTSLRRLWAREPPPGFIKNMGQRFDRLAPHAKFLNTSARVGQSAARVALARRPRG